ncbi:hypothetical protein [Methanolobus vulcani]|jgi:VIT1/CCC1 family predicted Fe2+/Mn2+ transporter|uniref:Uncharacterized protein n=1 Tax=Methanolobus vulcani TaxID=38026 RepID=A0A7Z8P1V5_9EURY|nr:hypothetical protein [Methanolobus vulcani]TQD24900.1 hypothetical protein FKV42_07440 [Methanolobus vulcani]
MKMAKIEIEEKTLKQNSLLMPVAVALGTLLAIIAYKFLPDNNTALITVFSGAIIVALITYAFLRKKNDR